MVHCCLRLGVIESANKVSIRIWTCLSKFHLTRWAQRSVLNRSMRPGNTCLDFAPSATGLALGSGVVSLAGAPAARAVRHQRQSSFGLLQPQNGTVHCETGRHGEFPCNAHLPIHNRLILHRYADTFKTQGRQWPTGRRLEVCCSLQRWRGPSKIVHSSANRRFREIIVLFPYLPMTMVCILIKECVQSAWLDATRWRSDQYKPKPRSSP